MIRRRWCSFLYLVEDELHLGSSDRPDDAPAEDQVEEAGVVAELEGLSERELITMLEDELGGK